MELAIAILDWLTPLFSLVASCDCSVNMGYLPYLGTCYCNLGLTDTIILHTYRLWSWHKFTLMDHWPRWIWIAIGKLQTYPKMLIFYYFMGGFTVSFKEYRVFKDTWSRMDTHSLFTNLAICSISISSRSLQFANRSNPSMYSLTIRTPCLQSWYCLNNSF